MAKVIVRENIRLQDLQKDFTKEILDLLWVNNPDYIKKVRMGFWIGKTPKKLNMFTRNKKDIIVPFGMLEHIKERLPNAEYDIKHSKHKVDLKLKQDLSLYKYQQQALDKVLEKESGILVSPAGSGKTRMAMGLIKARGVKTLWITHTLDLLNQSKRVYKGFFKNKAGQIASGKVDIQDVTFATIQTLKNMDLQQIKNSFEMIIVDEAHRVGGTPSRATMFYTVINNLNTRYKYGLTATLYEKQNDISSVPLMLLGNKLHEVLEENIERVTAKHIPIHLETPKSDLYLNPDRTTNYNELIDYLVYNQERNNVIVDNLLKVKDNHNIVLSNRNAHLEILSSMLDFYNIPNEILVGRVKTKDRERIINDFSKGKFNFILSNYQLTKEGLDLPIADTLHLVIPMRDKTTIVQSKGRVERVYKGKKASFVYDYLDKNIGTLYNMFKERRKHIE